MFLAHNSTRLRLLEFCLIKYFRRKLLQFEWSKTVSNLDMFRFKLIYIAEQVVFRRMLLLHELYITPL